VNKSKLRVLVLVNPGASRAQVALPALSSWFAERCATTFVVTNSKKERKRTLQQHGKKVDLIVIGGGDGTISRALPQLLKLKKPFAVLPLGTANDFARTIGLPEDPLQAAEVALNGRKHRIDVAFANDHPYLNVASIGLASKVAAFQSKELKRKWGVGAYAIALMRAISNIKPFAVHLELDGELAWSGSVYQVSIGNGRHHGGGLTVAQDATIDDGKFDLYLVYPGRLWQLIASLGHLKFGGPKPEVLQRLSAVSVTLSTNKSRVIDADGVQATETPARFELRPRALKVIVPRTLPLDHRGLSQTR
jgi:YegS/Rv2252/BmrU family lipid kinase